MPQVAKMPKKASLAYDFTLLNHGQKSSFGTQNSLGQMESVMKSQVFAAVAASLISGAALAADLPSKKEPAAPPAPVSVNGFDFAWGGKLMSDYVSRGVTQSNGNPSVTAYGEARYNIGDTQRYAGVQGWSVKLPTDPAAEIDLYGGVRQTIGKFAIDLGAIYYLYPGNTNQYWINNTTGTVLNQQTRPAGIPIGSTYFATTAKDPSFLELYAKPTFNITESFTVGANLYYSPNWNRYGFNSTYVSGTAKYTFGETGFSVSGEFGRQYLGTTKASSIYGSFAFPSYNTWNAGISYAYKVFTVDARYHGSSLNKAQCYAVSSDPKGNTNGGFSNWCGNRFMISLSADMTLKDLSGPASAVVAKY